MFKKRPAHAGVHTVAFMLSDGDNIQLLEGDWIADRWYGSPLRGSVPMGWSYSPAVATLMPNVMEWVHSTMTENDSLQAAPSGLGYTYPQLFPEKQRTRFANVTAAYMAQTEMSLLNVLGVIPSAESVAALAAQPEVDGIVYFTFSTERHGYSALHGNVAYVNDKPVVGARMNLWDQGTTGDKVGVKTLVEELKTLPK